MQSILIRYAQRYSKLGMVEYYNWCHFHTSVHRSGSIWSGVYPVSTTFLLTEMKKTK